MKTKVLYAISISLLFIIKVAGQGYNKNYRLLSSGDLTIDKNFYLITVIEKTPEVKTILSNNAALKSLLQKKVEVLKTHVTDTCSHPVSLLSDFFWKQDTAALAKELQTVYAANKKAFDKIIDGHLRPSGYYQRFVGLSNEVLLAKAWNQCFYGMDYIINQFGLGKKMRYPHIDSASYVVTSRSYRIMLKDMVASLNESSKSFDVFYKPSLAVAMQLMQANDRDEPARLEPLEKGINKAAYEQIQKTDWKKYKYAAIVLPGAGPELHIPIGHEGKLHCDAAARSYLAGDAPFIIPTGGYCYPFKTIYNEAVEMKKYLMEKYKIPASAIIAEPQARHTTTNIRNSVRLMIRYGIPVNMPSLFVTSMSQTKYSAAGSFDTRNIRELGYTPYTRKKQLSNHAIEFYPVMECLHMDPYDPLDP
ncbi:YdcF family protein [Emticicia sp. TH156]|uniref:YdcF family protein n=1 Tax=Emticicia sp. TH156 TaxID=2067454 RepID=UPI000C75CF0D|nr:YdcF family protein [Emticicia sp. TH156]PLK46464.1 YdcF family protein [Emticicia sp. TH156]